MSHLRSWGTVCALALWCAPVAYGTVWYVSPAGLDANAGTSLAESLRTLQAAANRTQPGDRVLVAEGDYTNACAGCSVVDITRSGTAEAWISYEAMSGASARVVFTGWNGFSLHGGASYIRITGFEIKGSRAQARFEACKAQSLESSPDPLCNGNGISIDGRKDGNAKPHHIRLDHNRVWQCAGGGIAVMQADYVTVEDNEVSENAWYSRYANSGISFYQAWNSDEATAVKMIIRRNRVSHNRSLVEWTAAGAPYKLSDGNGIIIDDYRGTQTGAVGSYKGRTLVENNLIYDCGGGGITIYASDHVDAFHNTAYVNSQVVDYAEVFVNQSGDVRVENNVMWSRSGATTLKAISATGLVLDYNQYFDGALKGATAGANDRTGDPGLAEVTTDDAKADFRPKAGSVVVGTGTGGLGTLDDLTGRERPASPSRGAFEPASLRPASSAPGRVGR